MKALRLVIFGKWMLWAKVAVWRIRPWINLKRERKKERIIKVWWSRYTTYTLDTGIYDICFRCLLLFLSWSLDFQRISDCFIYTAPHHCSLMITCLMFLLSYFCFCFNKIGQVWKCMPKYKKDGSNRLFALVVPFSTDMRDK